MPRILRISIRSGGADPGQVLAADQPHQALDRLVGVPQRPRQIRTSETFMVSFEQAVPQAIVSGRLRASEQAL